MTNMQLYLATGVPALLILSDTARMFYLFAQSTARFDKIDGRLDCQDGWVGARFNKIESRLERIEAGLRQFRSITGAHTEAIDTLKKRL